MPVVAHHHSDAGRHEPLACLDNSLQQCPVKSLQLLHSMLLRRRTPQPSESSTYQSFSSEDCCRFCRSPVVLIGIDDINAVVWYATAGIHPQRFFECVEEILLARK